MALKGMDQVVIVHFNGLHPKELKKKFEAHNNNTIICYWIFGFNFF